PRRRRMPRARLRELRRERFLRRAARRVAPPGLAAFGPTSLIAPPAVIHSPHRIEIGRRVILHRDAFLSVVEEHNGRRYSPHLRIGDGTSFGHGLWISCVGEIDIGREVLAGHNILITDTHHEYHDPDTAIVHQPMAPPRPVRIGDGAHLGPHAAVLAGVTIRERASVAATAVVTRHVPPHAVAVRTPAAGARRRPR